jgi:probable HAF family extracellular repeat protein
MRGLGTLGGSLRVGGQRSNAFGINDSSQVVGTSIVPGGNSHAFLWDDSAGMTDLMTLGGANSTANHIDNWDR